MEECKERDSSSDAERQIIEDDDMEDSTNTSLTDIDFVKEEETEEKGRGRQFLLR